MDNQEGDGGADDGNQDTSHNHEKTEHVLLVALEAAKVQVSSPTPVSGTAQQFQLEAKVEEIAKQITAKLDAIMRPGPTAVPGSATINLVFDPAATGLDGIKVTMTDSTLSVLLARSADAADDNITQVAMNLAHILQVKFPKRTVKILQSDETNDVAIEETDKSRKP